jgi:hypothetical protein
VADKTLRAFVDRIENGYAVILLEEDGQQIDWPIEKLPPGIVEGTSLTIDVHVENQE